MKSIALLLSICLSAVAAKGQNFGNEWINYNQTYYTIPIAEDGVYRITYSDFISAGIQINTVDPNNIRMYAFAEEVPIYIEGVGDGSFNSGDYIEFIGEANDGRRETVLYDNPADQPNPDYSLFSDTVRYFITVGTSGGSRFNEIDQNVEAYSPRNYVWHRSQEVFSNTYHDQPQLLDTPPFNNPNFRLSLSDFQVGEGWMSPRITLGNSRDVDLPTPGVYNGSDAPDTASVQTVVVGVSDMNVSGSDHHIQVRYGAEQTLAANGQFDGYRVNRFQFDIPRTALGETETTIRHRVLGITGVSRDDQAIARVQITYPRVTDIGGLNQFGFTQYFNTVQSRTRYDFENISGANPRIYTLGSNPQRIVPVQEDGLYKTLVANAPDQEPFDCMIVTDASVKTISGISRAGTNGTFTNFGASQVDSAFVIITHESLMAEAQLYTSYRQQDFNTVLVDVDELYDQFGFGAPKSGLAIRNFSNYILQQWSNTPQYLLLLGKSVRTATIGNLAGSRKSVVNSERNLVPSLGYPPSDNYLTSGLANTFLEPAIRTGRVSARNPQEVALYRSKLQEFESQPAALWMKNIMHFGGGLNTNEQQRFANYLNGYKTTAEGLEFGGVVHTFLKSNSEPLQINVSEEINTLIEDEGVSLMTFFAHAGSEGFDQSIDNPQNFDWNGKYPFLLGNGCFSGDYHSPNQSSTSEKYTLIQDKGVIGFLASVDLGIEGDLNLFSTNFYKQFADVNYGKSVGNHVRETIRIVQNELVLRRYLCYGMGLQGDPAVVLNSHPKPDLAISPENIFFTPENITADIDSFSVNVVVNNIGRATDETFGVTVEHNTPEGVGDSTYTQTLNGLYYRDTLEFKLPVDLQFGVGLHSFDVFVDIPENVIDELSETNNQVTGAPLFISSGGLIPVYPNNYAVVPDGEVVLKASTGNPLAELSTYRFEIDTTDTFDSPSFQSTQITQTGGLVEWQPAVNYPDSAVYFWRCAEITEEDTIWRESSFQYIPEREGWGQAQIFQFKNNNLSSLELNRDERQVDFFSGSVFLRNQVTGGSATGINNVVLNTSEVEYGSCFTTRSVHLVVLEPVSFDAWGTNFDGQNPDNDFGNVNANGGCRNRVEYYFIFRQTTEQLQALADLLQSNIIPDGHYVVLYSINNVNYPSWQDTPDIFDAFAELGATQIGAEGAQNNVPFSLIARKGDPGFVHELYGSTSTEVLINDVDIPASGTDGVLTTRTIGPASSWGSASWRTSSLDSEPGDEATISIIGVNDEGVETPLPGLSFSGEGNDVDLSSQISADQYPYLRLRASLSDEANATPLQIDRWHVLHNKVPEAAVNPNAHFVFFDETLQQGQDGYVSVAIENISDVDMDSLLVDYWIEDEARNRIDINYPRQDSLRAGEVLIDTIYFDTRNLSRRNVLWAEVNPRVETGNYDQPEQAHFNNLLQVSFDVEGDNENPLLDVTFDGIHIINGEIVSPRPEIVVSLKDENPFLLMDEPSDTALFKIFIAAPGGDYERRYFSSALGMETMEFIPATDNKNRARILFSPQLISDGDYKLLVQAADKSGNQSANIDYQIEFEVVNRSTISEVLNYPNPFSTSTQFVFTLTGAKVPDEFKIQIMTVSGKVVREITQAEIGPIRIGRNFSQYRWDGRDEFGDRLANGVYLYRVIARLQGEDITKRDNGASQYFTESFGKMVLFK